MFGDFSQASQYWSGINDGNNDNDLGDASQAHVLTNDNLLFFQHRSNAGMVSGHYNNTCDLGVVIHIIKLDPTVDITA